MLKIMMSTLNVGCGFDSWGDVRLEVERYSWRYKRKTTANVIGDAHHLPFRSDVFTKVRCYHVLEHLDNPFQAYKELKRVTKGEIIVRVPVWHLYSYLIETLGLFQWIALFKVSHAIYQLKQIKRWKERYSDHMWYIRHRGAKTNRLFWLPKEYEWTWRRRSRSAEKRKDMRARYC